MSGSKGILSLIDPQFVIVINKRFPEGLLGLTTDAHSLEISGIAV